jgi:hypothetical protein
MFFYNLLRSKILEYIDSIIIIRTPDYKSLQNQKNVRCVHSFDDLDCKWNVSVGCLWYY